MTIAITPFQAGTVINRAPGATSRTVAVSGTYDAGETSVQVRVVADGTTTPISGLDWQVPAGLTMIGGAWSGNLTVPQGGWYNLHARDFSTGVGGATVTNANRWGVGVNILTGGQSNMVRWFVADGTTLTPHAMTSKFASDGWLPMDQRLTWASAAGSSGNVARRFANAIAVALGGNIPVGIIKKQLSGTSIKGFLPAAYGGYPDSNTTLNGYYNDIAGGGALAGLGTMDGSSSANKAGFLSPLLIGHDFEMIVWQQGENDTGGGVSDYAAYLDYLWQWARDLTGRTKPQLPIVVVPLGTYIPWSAAAGSSSAWTTGADDLFSFTTFGMDAVRLKQASWCATEAANGAILSASPEDGTHEPGLTTAPLSQVHWTTKDYARMGRRYCQAALKALGLASADGAGPKIGVCTFDGTAVALNIVHRGGAALFDATGNSASTTLEGFRVFKGGVQQTINSASIVSASKIVLTLASALASGDTVTLDYLAGDNPGRIQWVTVPYKTFGNFAYDDFLPGGPDPDTLGSPLQPTYAPLTATYLAGSGGGGAGRALRSGTMLFRSGSKLLRVG